MLRAIALFYNLQSACIMKNKKNMKKNPNAFPDQVNKNVEKYIYHTNLLDRLKKSGREREKE